MSVPYQRVLDAILSNRTSVMRAIFDTLTVEEVVELATFIGPQRLFSVARQAIAARPLGNGAQRSNLAALLAETSRQAFNQPLPDAPAIDEPMRVAVRGAIRSVATRRAARPLLQMTADVSGTLPIARANPPTLTRQDYEASAERLGAEVAAIMAVAQVESSGSGFDARGRPKILFEAHYFARLTQNRFNATHPHLSFPYDRVRVRTYYAWNQYQRLFEALLLNAEAALQSASWGKFQIMGEWHSGWPTVRSFVNAMYVSEANHLIGFEAYCRDHNLIRFIRARDWLAFARGYNGTDQRGYDTRIAAAYQQLRPR